MPWRSRLHKRNHVRYDSLKSTMLPEERLWSFSVMGFSFALLALRMQESDYLLTFIISSILNKIGELLWPPSKNTRSANLKSFIIVQNQLMTAAWTPIDAILHCDMNSFLCFLSSLSRPRYKGINLLQSQEIPTAGMVTLRQEIHLQKVRC